MLGWSGGRVGWRDEGVGGGGGAADVGQPLMAPRGQICANYATNYTVAFCAPPANVNNNTISPFCAMNQAELVRPAAHSTPCTLCPFNDTPTAGSAAWGLGCSSPDFIHENSTSLHLPPPPSASLRHHRHQQRVTLCSCFILGSRDCRKFALQPPDSSASQLETAASLVRSPLAKLNIEPSAAVRDLINSSFKVCIMLSGLKDQSPRPLLFPSPIC